MKDAVEIDGVDMMGYTSWGPIDGECLYRWDEKALWFYLC